MFLVLAAIAAPELQVQVDEILYSGSRAATHGTVAVNSRGQARVDLGFQPIGGQRWSAVLFDEGGSWVARPHDGQMLAGPVDIWLVRSWAPRKRWRWEGRWVDLPGELPANVFNAHVLADGRMQVYTAEGRLVEGKDHRFRRVGPGPQASSSIGGVDADGEAVLAWVEANILNIRHAGGAARLPLGSSPEPVDSEQCMTTPCESVWDTTQLTGDIIALDGWIGVPYKTSHSTQELSCREEPPHPCDPAGPINTCPTEPNIRCTGPIDVVSSAGIAWVKGSHIESQVFAVPGVEVASATVDAQGRVHVVGPSDLGLRYLRLGSDEESVPARAVRLDPPGAVTLERHGMTHSGFIFQDRFQDARAPTPLWAQGSIQTGGEHGDGYWIAANPWLGDRSMALEVDVEVEPLAGGCGDPWVGLRHLGREFGVLFSDPIQIFANGEVLDTGLGAKGKHTVRVEVDSGEARVEVDGVVTPVELGEPSMLPGSRGYNSAEFGHFRGCGVYPYAKRPATTWSRVELR